MTIPGEITAGEHLGRGVFSSRNRSRARRGKTPHHVFLERGGEIEISVDRLDIAPAIEATEIADHVAVNRNATFYGWAVVVEERARANGRGAVATPQPGNPYHADIVLPAVAAEEDQKRERARLHGIIAEMVLWEATHEPRILNKARYEIARSLARARGEAPPAPGDEGAVLAYLREHAPPVCDPFCGGGSIPLEAQRLGLRAHGSDLNPVAVLVSKATCEIPPKFAGRPPVNPERDPFGVWQGAQGLAEDIRYYGKWMRDEAEKRIGHLYPKVEITEVATRERADLRPYVGRELTVIAWLWARTVASPDPMVRGAHVPLVSSFVLSSRKGNEAIVVPVVDRGNGTYRFTVKASEIDADAVARAKQGTKAEGSASFTCVISGAPMSGDAIRAEGRAGRLGARLMAVVAEGKRGRIYLEPSREMEETARAAKPKWKPDIEFFRQALGFRIGNYGMSKWSDLFTPRQLVALTTFSDLIPEVRGKVLADGRATGTDADATAASGLAEGGSGTEAYVDAVATYLGLCVGRLANRGSNLSFWNPGRATVEQVFARQALPPVWDFCESNPFSDSSGNFIGQLGYLANAIAAAPSTRVKAQGAVIQQDAAGDTPLLSEAVIATDPPYYDNIGYADLSDFFYVWQRRALFDVTRAPRAARWPERSFACAQPGDQIAIFGEALQEIASRSAHLYRDGDRYWFSPQPTLNTLNKLAADRARDVGDDDADRRIVEVLREEQASRAGFPRVHAAPDDLLRIDDRRTVALVILPPAAVHDPGAGAGSRAAAVAGETIERRGSGHRRYRNALVFVAADASNVEAARENARRERAWQSILDDADLGQNLTLAQTNDAEAQTRRSREALRQSVRGAWVHVLHPGPPDGMGAGARAGEAAGVGLERGEDLFLEQREMTLGATSGRGYVIRSTRIVNRGGGKSVPEAVWDKVGTDGTVFAEIGPANLMQSLAPIWPSDRPHLSIDDIRDWFASYVYLPRLRDEATLDGALQRLVENLADPYAYASGFDEASGAYEGVMDGRALLPGHFRSGLLVRREALPAARPDSASARPGDGGGVAPIPTPPKPKDDGEATPTLAPPRPRRFFASLAIDPERAGLEVARVMDGLLVELTRAPGSNLRLHLEIEGAAGDGGYPEDVVETVKANARDLRLDPTGMGFEDE